MKIVLPSISLKLVSVLIGLLACGCAMHEANKSSTVRLRFVPGDAPAGRGGGASWCALHPFPGAPPGVLMAMAHAGLGDTFPVKEENSPKLFDIAVVAGDDDHLLLEVRAEDGTQKIDLRRDKSVSMQVTGRKYQFSYPSVHVARTAKPTTTKAMLLVHGFP